MAAAKTTFGAKGMAVETATAREGRSDGTRPCLAPESA